MVMAIDGTFDYTFDVTRSLESGVSIRGLSDPPVTDGTRRLVGYRPRLEAVEYQPEPWQVYARITLRATDTRHATVASASFSVDRGLVRVLRPGDLLHLCRTSCAGMGLSIVRAGYLVAAAGAITKLPLGADVSARHPHELIEQAEAIFRTRAPDYQMGERPIEMTFGGITTIVPGGRHPSKTYEMFVRHGYFLGLPGTDESISIERKGMCPETAAHTSAKLLEVERIRMSE